MAVRPVTVKNSGEWIANAAPVGGPSPNRVRKARRNNAKIGSAHVAIVSALFLVMFAATLLVGGHAAIDSLVLAATEPQDPRHAGAVVYTMPDGVFCRHVSFDNVTAQVTEGPIKRCADDPAMSRARVQLNRAFTWQSN